MKKQCTAHEALQQIKQYFTQAHTKDQQKGKLIIQKARKLAMKHRIKLPKELKRQYCAHCYTFFIPGKNYRVRTAEGRVVYTCLCCGKHTRFSYITQQKIKRKLKHTERKTNKKE